MFISLNKNAVENMMKEKTQDITIRFDFENTHRTVD